MDTAMFEKFNSMFDLEGLKNDAANAGGDFEQVPYGDYEVAIEKLEIGVTGEKSKNPGMPQVKVWFKIVAGEYRNQRIFMNQGISSGFGLHKMNEFLTSLESGIPIDFVDFVQYNALLTDVLNAVKGYEYQLAYGQNEKGFDIYTIVQKFN